MNLTQPPPTVQRLIPNTTLGVFIVTRGTQFECFQNFSELVFVVESNEKPTHALCSTHYTSLVNGYGYDKHSVIVDRISFFLVALQLVGFV